MLEAEALAVACGIAKACMSHQSRNPMKVSNEYMIPWVFTHRGNALRKCIRIGCCCCLPKRIRLSQLFLMTATRTRAMQVGTMSAIMRYFLPESCCWLLWPRLVQWPAKQSMHLFKPLAIIQIIRTAGIAETRRQRHANSSSHCCPLSASIRQNLPN